LQVISQVGGAAHNSGKLWFYAILLSVNLCSDLLVALCLRHLPRSLLSCWRDGSGPRCPLGGLWLWATVWLTRIPEFRSSLI